MSSATHNAQALWPALRRHWQDLADLTDTLSLMGWDQSTYLPPEAAQGRARQSSLISGIRHSYATQAEYGRLLEAAHQLNDLSADQQRLLAMASKYYDESTRLPARLVSELAQHQGESYAAWTTARPQGNFAPMIPYLEKTLDLSLEIASAFPEYGGALDYFVQQADEGMSSAEVSSVFGQLKAALIPLIDEVLATPAPRTDFLFRHYPEQAQLTLSESIIRDYGYSFERGRQDLSPHPFMTRLGEQDIRVTTRVNPNDLTETLYSTLHEAGHALYEQGIAPTWLGTPLGGGVSSGIHESQSRLWENQVGRSRAFWAAYFDEFQAVFPEQLADVSADEMYRAVNRVQRSLIRTDADELTYNLHVIIRFELERELLDGRLAVRDLAQAWQDSYQQTLGICAPNDTDGVLQDVHWYAGHIGGVFQSYSLGNVMSAQFFAAAKQALPELESQIARKTFAPLLQWLTEHVYQHGGRYTPQQLLQQATGEGLSVAPYVAYLQEKYRVS